MPETTPVVSYVVRTFPKLSESFVVRELLALQRAGVAVEIWSLLPGDDGGRAAAGRRLLVRRARQSRAGADAGAGHAAAFQSARRTVLRPGRKSAIGAAQTAGVDGGGVTAAAPLTALVRTPPQGPLGMVRMLGELGWLLLRRPLAAVRAIVWALRWSVRERDPRHAAALPYAAHLARHAAAPHLHAHFANTPATTAVLAGMLSGRLTVSYTGHARDLWVATSPAFLGEKTERCAFAVSGTQFAVDRMRDACRPGRAPVLEVVTNAVDLPELSGTTAEDVATGADRTVAGDGATGTASAARREAALVVCTARLVEKKGIDVLIRAVAALADDVPGLRLELIGDGPDREALEALSRELNVTDRILFRGAQPYAAVTAALRRATVFALPAREAADGDTDGLPVAILEALAHEVPVVATPIAGIPEAVVDGETGLLVAPDDPAATAAAIRTLLDDPALRARLGAAGRTLVGDRYDADTSAATLARLFRSAR